MVFASMTFLWIFLPAVLCLYWIAGLSGKQEVKNFLLLFVSLLFYAFGEPKYILLLLLSALLNFLGGLWISRAGTGAGKRAALAVSVCLNLLLLGYFKYAAFLSGLLNGLFSAELLPIREIALPIGISFYTFQAMSYIIDLYRGKCEVQKSFWKLLLYISFFPQLIAGPIVRYRDVAEQIDCREENLARFSSGALRFSCGLAKKVILANTFAARVDAVFACAPGQRTMAMAWYALFLYGMQIYFDFSGYSDMAIGLGRLFGFEFLENFRFPYMAASVSEFWRRWHISLSSWFQEYVYIPLGGNRKGLPRTCLNLLFVFFLTGLWHGAGLTFVLWGVAHGIFVLMERLFPALSKKKGQGTAADKTYVSILRHLYCLLAVYFTWVLFRAESLQEAGQYLQSMFSLSAISPMSFREFFGIKCMVLSGLGILFCTDLPHRLCALLRRKAPLFYAYASAAGMAALLFASFLLLVAGSYNPFIYFRF